MPPFVRASFALLLLPTLLAGPARSADPGETLVTVNGKAITRADLEFEFVTSGVPEAKRDEVRRKYLEALVEAELLAGFLRKRKVVAPPELVDEQVQRIRRMITLREMDPDAVLKQVGYDDASLRRKLELPIAWESYARQIVRPADVRKFWEKHRTRFDGTRLKASQILRRLPADADESAVAEARAVLEKVRADVTAGNVEFAEAAREHSEAPSARSGGDVGWFPYRGKMPVSFTEPVFAVEKGGTTAPFRSPFGLHLVQVTDAKPGRYSLEDVRVFVFDALADEVRASLIEKERATATIEWAD